MLSSIRILLFVNKQELELNPVVPLVKRNSFLFTAFEQFFINEIDKKVGISLVVLHFQTKHSKIEVLFLWIFFVVV